MDEAPEFFRTEFTALRAEIDRRSTSQQGIIVVFITAAGVAATVASRGGQSLFTLLILPFAGLAFSRLYLDHHLQIERIGKYLLDTWATRLSGAQTWEAWLEGVRTGEKRLRTDHLWRSPPAYIFVGTSLAAVVIASLVMAISPPGDGWTAERWGLLAALVTATAATGETARGVRQLRAGAN